MKQRKPENKSEPKTSRKPTRKSDPVATTDRERIRQLVEIYQDVQDTRIRSGNRLRSVGGVEGVDPAALMDLEKQIKKYIQKAIKKTPIYVKFLSKVRGLGPILAGGLIANLDPAKADHASSFHKFCGLHVEDGHAVRREKGKKLGFNIRMRTLSWKIGDSFIKQRTPKYRKIYDETKLEEARKLNDPVKNPKNCPLYKDCIARLRGAAKRKGRPTKKTPCKAHIDNRARRKMVKIFLIDLWAEWRALEGLPVSDPYPVGILGHDRRD